MNFLIEKILRIISLTFFFWNNSSVAIAFQKSSLVSSLWRPKISTIHEVISERSTNPYHLFFVFWITGTEEKLYFINPFLNLSNRWEWFEIYTLYTSAKLSSRLAKKTTPELGCKSSTLLWHNVLRKLGFIANSSARCLLETSAILVLYQLLLLILKVTLNCGSKQRSL